MNLLGHCTLPIYAEIFSKNRLDVKCQRPQLPVWSICAVVQTKELLIVIACHYEMSCLINNCGGRDVFCHAITCNRGEPLLFDHPCHSVHFTVTYGILNLLTFSILPQYSLEKEKVWKYILYLSSTLTVYKASHTDCLYLLLFRVNVDATLPSRFFFSSQM